MTRFPDWPARLAALTTAALHERFEWGAHDCFTFAADAVFEITGEDPLRGLRGRWTTAVGAARVLARHGGMTRAVSDVLGTPAAAAFAHRGDIVLLPSHLAPDRWAGCLAVSFGGLVGTPGAGGLVLQPAGEAALCWHIGSA